MIIKFIGAVLLLAAPYKLFCQKNNTAVDEPSLTLRFNFLGLTDPSDQNLSFGIEKRFHTNWSTGTDAGWIFSSYIQTAKSVNGLIFRPFIRYYPRARSTFWEAELHYKYVNYKIEDWLGRDPVNNVPAFQEYTIFDFNKESVGIQFKWGVQANLSRDKRLKFEFTGGLGVRSRTHKVPGGIYTPASLFNNFNTEKQLSAVVPINARLIYVLK
ncbi:MAG: DUF3575 domain-containing protein [Chitinophagaceae bacterium]|nr:DUF3575 domain-containing protein [Chitinophagaceae bacterium]